MFYFPRSAMSTSSVHVSRLPVRLSGCFILTGFNLYVILTCAPTLFRAAVHHPLWLAGDATLFASLLGSLFRVWNRLIFRGASR